MPCQKVHKYFSALRDQALTLEQEKEMKAHLHGCVDCAQAWEAYGRLFDAAFERAQIKLPAGVWPRFWGTLAQDRKETKWWRIENGSQGLMSATAVGIALFLLMWNWMSAQAEVEFVALQSFLTKSQVGKVLVVF